MVLFIDKLQLAQQQNTPRVLIREAIPSNHALPGDTVVTHMSIEVPKRSNGVPLGAVSSTPTRDTKKVGNSELLSTNRSQTPFPSPKGVVL